LAVLFAAALRSFTGFGFALAAVPVLSLLLPPTEAVVLSSALALALGVVSVRRFWSHVVWTKLFAMGAMSIIGTYIGVRILVSMSTSVFQVCVGLSVLAACIALKASPDKASGERPLVGGVAGFVSGLMNGAMAIPGPPIIVYALYVERDPVRSRALMMCFFSLSAAIALTAFAGNGLLDVELLPFILFALPALFLGDWIGAGLFRRHADQLYRRISLLTLFVIGVSSVLSGIL
jgi:uncharacterized protein